MLFAYTRVNTGVNNVVLLTVNNVVLHAYIKLQQTCWLQACISLDEINSLLQTVSRVSEIKYIIILFQSIL